MSASRLEQLLQYYRDEPGDPFILYALALEYQKSDLKKAKSFFEKLLNEHAHYVPAYYHAAKLYQELQERDKAESTYEKGIVMAKMQNDFQTLRELQSALDELRFE